jgi:hypothetical protein
MYATYPIYYPSARWARENREIDLWRESFKINKGCRDYINNEASMAYHEERLPAFVKELTDIYGLERAMFVMARFIVAADWDKRYDGNVKERAGRFDFADMREGKVLEESGQDPYKTADHTQGLYSNVHPVILNAVFRRLMKMEQEQVNLPTTDTEQDNELDGEVEQ